MQKNNVKIIYEDNDFIVANKPSGLLVIPTPKNEKNTLTNILNNYLRLKAEEANVHPCHRIDRETSGLVIYAKGKKNQQLMMDEFKERKVKKAYIAFAHGRIKPDSGAISEYIYNKNKKRNEPAVTKYKVTQQCRDFTVLTVEPVTGRTNQIRIHFKSIGHPLVGESVYAFRKDFALRFKRVALHAESLSFFHPVTGKMLKFSAPLPQDMSDFLNKNY